MLGSIKLNDLPNKSLAATSTSLSRSSDIDDSEGCCDHSEDN